MDVNIYSCAISHPLVLFGEVSASVLCPFSNWTVCFLTVECKKLSTDWGYIPCGNLWFVFSDLNRVFR